MPISFEYDPTSHIVTSVASGDITPADSEASHQKVLELRREHPGMRLLVDMREAHVAASAAGVIAIIEAFFELVGTTVPVAFLNRDEADNPNSMLAETRAFIAGAAMRAFTDGAEARTWLAGKVRRPGA
jgi:hypothetical protein